MLTVLVVLVMTLCGFFGSYIYWIGMSAVAERTIRILRPAGRSAWERMNNHQRIVLNWATLFFLWLVCTYYSISWEVLLISCLIPWVHRAGHGALLIWITAFLIVFCTQFGYAQARFNGHAAKPTDSQTDPVLLVSHCVLIADIVFFFVFVFAPKTMLLLWSWVPFTHTLAH